MVSTRSSTCFQQGGFNARRSARMTMGLNLGFPQTATITKANISREERFPNSKMSIQPEDDEDDVIIVDSRSRRNTSRIVYTESETESESRSEFSDEDEIAGTNRVAIKKFASSTRGKINNVADIVNSKDEVVEESEGESEDESEESDDDDEDGDFVDTIRVASKRTTNKTRGTRYRAPRESMVEFEYETEDEVDTIEVVSQPASRNAIDRTANAGTPVTQESLAAALFKNLSLEIHQSIIQFLPTDRDIVNYALVSKALSLSVYDTVWRMRSQCTFDELPSLGSVQVKKLAMRYKYRRNVSKKWTCFDLLKHGARIDKVTREFQLQNQKHCLQMLRGLILESNAKIAMDRNGNQVVKGLNFQYIRDMLTGENGQSYVDIIDAVFNTNSPGGLNNFRDMTKILSAATEDSLVYIIQLCLTPFSLHPEICNTRVSHFEISQFHAYERSSEQPIFVGKYKQEINARWLLHTVNFFKYHLKAGGEGLLAHAYSDLEAHQYPRPWVGLIQAGTRPLGSHWKGAYMYMESNTLISLRTWNGDSPYVHPDFLDGNEAFQDISVFFDESQFSAKNWPNFWEDVLCSDPFKDMELGGGFRTSTRARPFKQINKPEVKEFWGSCRGSKEGHFYGRIHSMIPQQGIHGFQRVTMMKFYTTITNGSHSYDATQVWAYEGCVLPGGTVIVGRWWDVHGDPEDIDCLSGPFLWWNVAKSEASPEIEPKEAFDFMDLVDPELALC